MGVAQATAQRTLYQSGNLQNAATADNTTNGSVTDAPTVEVNGINGAMMVEVRKTNTGTCTLNFEGSLDGTNWYAVRYAQDDATASPTVAASGLAVLATNPFPHTYMIYSSYRWLRARISASSGTYALTVSLYAVPQ